MLHTLQRHLTEAQTAWMREHLEFLIEEWKREVRREAFVDRPTLVQMKAAEYVPVAPSRKRYRGMVTEEGELEIEEDDDGNITLGGEALSFETWAKLTKSSEPDIVCAKVTNDEPPMKKSREMHDFKKFKQSQKEWKEKKINIRKMRITQQAREELNALDKCLEKDNATKEAENGKEKKENTVIEKISKPAKELDEGEIDSEEERKEAKEKKRLRRKVSSSSNSTTTSSSSETDDDGDARKRRRNRRKTERMKGPQVPPLFQRMFNYRHVIINSLSAEHKTAFASVLHQMKSSGRTGISQTDQQQMITFLSSFSR
ncbi:hypothetical protein DICVIV_05009 [Dictyocaulus viviparus]|uniref:Uncharacterized protein n=1 Tax=Dictyocaulus viviparus TaxID=29172 RepID=A0A0D8XW73_DICVI|nr:hypothetical protein DICVIV_05009 [Dictyocaulus viviparus]